MQRNRAACSTRDVTRPGCARVTAVRQDGKRSEEGNEGTRNHGYSALRRAACQTWHARTDACACTSELREAILIDALFQGVPAPVADQPRRRCARQTQCPPLARRLSSRHLAEHSSLVAGGRAPARTPAVEPALDAEGRVGKRAATRRGASALAEHVRAGTRATARKPGARDCPGPRHGQRGQKSHR